jgi:death-on-curing protein
MEYRWIGPAVALAVHAEQLSEHGGSDGVRDMGLLESALARPLNLVNYGEPDVAALAACYASGIAWNHPFVDGNKRTAFVVAMTFLYLTGFRLEAEMVETYQTMMALALKQIDEEAFASWVRTYLREL